MIKKITVAVLLCLYLTGCSVYQAARQPGPADLSGIGIGTPRQDIISRLGTPKMVDNDPQGNKQDYFEFVSGMHQASKARILLYLAADVFTAALAEAIIWPLELSVMDAAKCNGVATYDKDLKVTSWWVHNKNDSAQDC